jgi:hypothetical protein
MCSLSWLVVSCISGREPKTDRSVGLLATKLLASGLHVFRTGRYAEASIIRITSDANLQA